MSSIKTKTRQYFNFAESERHCIAGILIIPKNKEQVYIYVAWENEPAAQEMFFSVCQYVSDKEKISIHEIIQCAKYGTAMPESEARYYFPHLF